MQMILEDFQKLVFLSLIPCKGKIEEKDDPKQTAHNCGHHEFSRQIQMIYSKKPNQEQGQMKKKNNWDEDKDVV